MASASTDLRELIRSGAVLPCHREYNQYVREIYRLERLAEGDEDPPDVFYAPRLIG